MMHKSFLLIGLGLVVVASLGLILGLQPRPLPKYDEFPIYPLIDSSGQDYQFDNEKIKIITFFYTRCPDICPITINDLTKLHEQLKKSGLLATDVDILTITLDPEYDNEAVLTKYGRKFQVPNNENWYFLRGNEDDIRKLTDDLGFYREETGGYWSHSTTIYLVDYDNRKRAFYQMSTPKEPLNIQKIMRDIRLLKNE